MGHFASTDKQEIVVPGVERRRGMRNRRRNVSTGSSRGMGSQLLGLSLFIMLLAFFIVLNAVSNYEDNKVRPIMESLSYAFAAQMLAENVDERPTVTQSEEKSVNEGSTVERLEALFNSQIPNHKAVVSSTQGTMHVRLAFDDFEAAVMAIGQRSAVGQSETMKYMQGFFLPTLVALMKTERTGAPYRMDMLVNVPENPAEMQNSQPKEAAAMIGRMGRIAGKIEDAGLETRLLSTGLQKGDAGMVELLFRPHIPFSPVRQDNEEE